MPVGLSVLWIDTMETALLIQNVSYVYDATLGTFFGAQVVATACIFFPLKVNIIAQWTLASSADE